MRTKKQKHVSLVFCLVVAIAALSAILIWRVSVPMMLESTYLLVETGKLMIEQIT
jgi:hypothetical protein